MLYLVRHGESVANKSRLHHMPTTPLSEEGIRQAKVVAERLKNIDIDFIYSSPQERAKQTAEIISKQKNLSIEYWEDLKEIRFPSEIWGKSKKVCVIQMKKHLMNLMRGDKMFLTICLKNTKIKKFFVYLTAQ